MARSNQHLRTIGSLWGRLRGPGLHPPPTEQPEPTDLPPLSSWGGCPPVQSILRGARRWFRGAEGIAFVPLGTSSQLLLGVGKLPGSRKSLLECVALIMPG